MTRKLSPQEAAFCRHYVMDGARNGADAARAAGYSVKTAKMAASRMLKRPQVKAEIARLEAEALKHTKQVNSLMTSVNQGADRSKPAAPGSIAQQIRSETDADQIAILTRAAILAIVYENLEICAGRRLRKMTLKPKGAKAKAVVIEFTDPNPSAANQAALILLAAPEIAKQAPVDGVADDPHAALVAAISEFEKRR